MRQAMKCSLSEGWSLLLHLLDKRKEVLRLAADFYHSLVEVRRFVNITINGIFEVLYVLLQLPPLRKEGGAELVSGRYGTNETIPNFIGRVATLRSIAENYSRLNFIEASL